MKNPSEFKGIVETTDGIKNKVKLQEDEKVLFVIGEVRWFSNGNNFINVVQMAPGFFSENTMKNAVVTSKRIILPMTQFLGFNIDYIHIYYNKSSLESAPKAFYRKNNFWINNYSLGEDSIIFNLNGNESNLGIILNSSVSNKITEVLSASIGSRQA